MVVGFFISGALLEPFQLGLWKELLAVLLLLAIPCYAIERLVPREGFNRRQWVVAVVVAIIVFLGIPVIRVLIRYLQGEYTIAG
jgi:hypothetical protein